MLCYLYRCFSNIQSMSSFKQVQHQQSNTWQYLNHLESVSKNDWTCSNVLYLSSPISSGNMCVGKPPLLAEGPPVGGPFERQKSPNLSLPESKFQQKNSRCFVEFLIWWNFPPIPKKTSGFKNMLPDVFHMYGNMFICFIRKTSYLFSLWVNVGMLFHTWSINIWGGSLVSSENSRLVILIFLLD